MLNKVEIVYVIFALSFFLCQTLRASNQSRNTISFDEYKKKHHLATDQECLDGIISNLHPQEALTIMFRSRVYHFDATIEMDSLESNINFVGTSGTVWNIGETLLKATALKFEYPLLHEVKKGDEHFYLLENAVRLGLVKFSSDDTVETAWGYTANDLMAISEVNADFITFKDSLNFGYTPARTKVYGYGKASIEFHHIKFQVNHSISHIMTLTGMQVGFESCKILYTDSSMMVSAINLQDCYNVRAKDIEIRGNIDYGFLVNGSRNIYFNKIRSYQCIHPLVPATFSTHIVVDKLYGNGSVIDAHPSFDVTYKNVTIVNGNGYWNCRTLGVVLENCDFQVKDEEKGNSLYLGVQGLTKKYEYLYDVFDIKCKNVNWVHQDYVYNGLHVGHCRDFIVENCTSHAITTGYPIHRFEVIHCKVGRVYSSDSNFSIVDSKFKAKLQNKSPIQPPLSCSYNGKMEIRNCTFTGYEDTYLFNYIQAKDTDIHFISCNVKQFKGFAAKTYADQNEYSEIHFQNCKVNREAKSSFEPFNKIEFIK